MRKKKSPPLTIKSIKSRGYTPAYEARLIRAVRKARKQGKKPNRQTGRGHKAKEHIERKQREREARGITRDEERSIRKFYAERMDPEAHPWKWSSSGSIQEAIAKAPTVSEFLEFALVEGYEKFSAYRKVWNWAHLRYRREQAAGTYYSREMPYLKELTHKAAVDNMQWLYYH